MAAQYGLRTKDAAAVVTLDTTVTPIRSLKMMQVVGNGAFDQYISIPEIQAQSFVVVDTLRDGGSSTYSPPAWYSPGQLQLRQPGTDTWQVMILSQGGEPFAAPGSYGIRARNGNSAFQIDSVNRILGIRYSGGFQLGVISPGNIIGEGGYDFPAPITTYERPLIFLNATDYMMVGRLRILGGPGNWTGFRIYNSAHSVIGSAWTTPMNIKWFCASFMSSANASGLYGARVRGANGENIFVSPDNIGLLNSQPASNSFVTAGTPITGAGGYYASAQQMPWTGNAADYILANALFSMTNIGQTTQPIRANFGGFLPGNRGVVQMWCENTSGINPVLANGRTTFACRPMKPL